MPDADRIPVFDGHNDTLLRLMEDPSGEADSAASTGNEDW